MMMLSPHVLEETSVGVSLSIRRALQETMFDEDGGFEDLFPLQTTDYIGFACAIFGIMIAAGGGIGGGGILVPIFILLFEFPVKHAIPLASVTVLGGACANNLLNFSKRDPRHPHRTCIDWDLILQLEPMTISGAIIGTALNDLLPDLVLIIFLLALLTLTAHKTLIKARAMYKKEDQLALQLQQEERNSLIVKGAGMNVPYGSSETAETDPSSAEEAASGDEPFPGEAWRLALTSATKLTCLFIIVTLMNLLKGGTSEGGGPMGLSYCGQTCFWISNGAIFLVILVFSIWVRRGILRRLDNDGPIISDIHWDEHNTISFPAMAIVAGLAAGMFGIGGGIVKGPLMLALGVHASVASATSACMILFTATTSTVSYMIFGLMNYSYAVACFVVGFLATLAGQTIMTALLAKYQRHSYIAYSIGLVVALSAVAMGIESIISILES